VGPDDVSIIEVKDIALEIEITEQNLCVAGDQRPNPFLTSRLMETVVDGENLLNRRFLWPLGKKLFDVIPRSLSV
jgi:hypothetical protein